jgi:hypothetical protein
MQREIKMHNKRKGRASKLNNFILKKKIFLHLFISYRYVTRFHTHTCREREREGEGEKERENETFTSGWFIPYD